MKSLSKKLTKLAVCTLAAMAMTGLVFPPHIMANPVNRVANVIDHLTINVLEMSADGIMPARFTVTTNTGESFLFEASGSEGFNWRGATNPELAGFQALPNLEHVADWQIVENKGGFFEAELPLSHFGASLPEFEKLNGGAEPVLTTLGYFDQATKSFEMSTVTPNNDVLEVTVSFAGLSDVEILGSGQLVQKGIVIVITFSTLLILLGVVFIACLGMFSACYIGCSLMCPGGVKKVISAICGVGCTCECNL